MEEEIYNIFYRFFARSRILIHKIAVPKPKKCNEFLGETQNNLYYDKIFRHNNLKEALFNKKISNLFIFITKDFSCYRYFDLQ